ncbi:hypothetical protein ACL02U_00905 [Streptomyces sp. MS06]|uniref:hypothetical protein n=1 Tax=Streptomyces sp. MS06 TaxID=3385974 RepID=UPI00399FB695
MSAAPTAEQPRPRPATATAPSMRELLASCAAADAVSRPPQAPDHPAGNPGAPDPDHRAAA